MWKFPSQVLIGHRVLQKYGLFLDLQAIMGSVNVFGACHYGLNKKYAPRTISELISALIEDDDAETIPQNEMYFSQIPRN